MASSGSSGAAVAGRSLGTVLLAMALVLSTLAFAGTRVLRSEPDIVNSVVVPERFDPASDAPARIRFELTVADERADVLIVDERSEQARALVLETSLEAGPQTFLWDGRDDHGAPVAAGPYRLRVMLGEQGREIEPPGTIEVVR